MIRIDLLPPELRGTERTATGTFLGMIGLVVFTCLSAVGVAYAWFGIVGGARGDIASATEILDSRKPRAEYSDHLEEEKKDYTSRLDHIKTFSSSRVLWTKKLDQLWTLVDSPSEADKYTIWFNKLNMDMASIRAPGLTLKGDSESSRFDRLSAFHSDLRSGAFASDFEGITNPTGEVRYDTGYEPSDSCSFEFTLSLMDRSGETGKKDAKKKNAAGKKPVTETKAK